MFAGILVTFLDVLLACGSLEALRADAFEVGASRRGRGACSSITTGQCGTDILYLTVFTFNSNGDRQRLDKNQGKTRQDKGCKAVERGDGGRNVLNSQSPFD